MDSIIHRIAGTGLPRRLNPAGYLVRRNAEYRMRRRMRQIEDWQLDDLGLTRADIEAALDRR